jgi:valyl-tRNA synthetase
VFMPFVTEEIYRILPVKNKKKALIIETWPK